MKSILVALMVTISVFAIANTDNGGYEKKPLTDTYTVRSGDTLWGIAREVSDEKDNVTNVVLKIEEDNETGACISTGQKLAIRR